MLFQQAQKLFPKLCCLLQCFAVGNAVLFQQIVQFYVLIGKFVDILVDLVIYICHWHSLLAAFQKSSEIPPEPFSGIAVQNPLVLQMQTKLFPQLFAV